jgi:hypothetical protein
VKSLPHKYSDAEALERALERTLLESLGRREEEKAVMRESLVKAESV